MGGCNFFSSLFFGKLGVKSGGNHQLQIHRRKRSWYSSCCCDEVLIEPERGEVYQITIIYWGHEKPIDFATNQL